MSFRPARYHLVPIRWPWSLHSDGAKIQSNHQCGDLPSFPITMAYKSRSPVTKTRGLTELHFFLTLVVESTSMGHNSKLCFTFMCPTKKAPSTDTLYPVPYWCHDCVTYNLPLYFFYWTCAILKIMVMFLPDINLTLIFILDLNAPFLWSPPITRSIDMIDSFLFASSHIMRDISKARIKSASLYQKLMCSFSIHFYLSYSYVPYYASIYPVPKIRTPYSGKIARFPNAYII